ncbi:hypothetical protein [Chengkuizengella sediminis]|uniref:hypothetical protein n=1 Tax=Chengkuizengella sediminis TaxID=1885917 RepID=UPI00138A0E78|nr:hypothetical protein [Chengkuizengella sediminis]NDI35180.1 hypothetical protein [Chengkuizengella sediminis]
MPLTGKRFPNNIIHYCYKGDSKKTKDSFLRAASIWNETTNVELFEHENSSFVLFEEDLSSDQEGIFIINKQCTDNLILEAQLKINSKYSQLYNEEASINLALHLFGYVMGLQQLHKHGIHESIMIRNVFNRFKFKIPQRIDTEEIDLLYAK